MILPHLLRCEGLSASGGLYSDALRAPARNATHPPATLRVTLWAGSVAGGLHLRQTYAMQN